MRPSDLTPAHLAHAAGIPEPDLWGIANAAEENYHPRRYKWVKRKFRPIDEPHAEYKAILGRIHQALQGWKLHHPSAEGGNKGHSYLTAARRHCGSAWIVTRDVQRAFPSIKWWALQPHLLHRGFQKDTAHLLTRLMTVHGQIPHGSPLSSDAINLFFYDTDCRIASVCASLGLRYHRNIDDLVVSAANGMAGSKLLAGSIGDILDSEIGALRLLVNDKKRRQTGFQTGHGLQLVHNVVVNNAHGIGLPAEQCHEVLRLAVAYVSAARAVSPDSLKPLVKARRRLAGWYYCSRQYEFSPADHVWAMIRAGDRLVVNRLRRDGVTLRRDDWWSGTNTIHDHWLGVRRRPSCAA